jgi:hypothetical protein
MDELDRWPASDGLPEVADDDSYADAEHEVARDQDHVPPLPPDREDGPVGLDDYWIAPITPGQSEPLDIRLARELPDVGARVSYEDPDPRITEDLDPDEVAQVEEDSRTLAETEPIDPHLGSHISIFDRPVPGIPFDAGVGELIRTGDGNIDDEPDEVAFDLGPAPGGLGNEELAMHEMPPEQVDLEAAESTSEPYVTRPSVPIIRTGAEQPWEPEDLAVAEGHDPTPRNVERARNELRELGPAAIEKTVP